MDNRKWYKNPEMIVALSALMIGLVTAFTSIYSAFIDRGYARSSVWPRVEIYKSFSDKNFNYQINNSGTGPALINTVKVKRGEKFLKRWSEIKLFTGNNVSQSQLSGRTLPAQQLIIPILYKGDDAKTLLAIDDSISIELCYCSIYDECWLIDKKSTPAPISHCVIDDKDAFLQ